MITFNNCFTFHIARGRLDECTGDKWVNKFLAVLDCANVTESTGAWVGEKVIETERTTKVSSWGVSVSKALAAVQLAHEYQAECAQEAVAIEITVNGVWAAYILFDESDWQEFDAIVRRSFVC
jgi:hypothetical protein